LDSMLDSMLDSTFKNISKMFILKNRYLLIKLTQRTKDLLSILI
jgi:hypothetical protein